MPLNILVVGASGGLGSALAREALRRGHSVSALVRSSEKLGEMLGADASRLKAVHVGSASDPAVVTSAMKEAVVCVSAAPPDPAVASTLGKAAKEVGAKLGWTAGT